MEKKQEKKKLGLTTLIFISLLLGAGFGIILHYWIPEGYVRDTVIINGVFYVVGNGFLRAMQMLVVPLVFCSIVCGSMSIGDTKTLGKVGVKAMGFYLVTTALAITLALSVANLIDPGVGMDVSSLETAEAAAAAENISFADTLLNIIPKNPIQGLAEGNMLQIIFFAIFVGILLAKRGERSAAVAQFFSQFNDLMMDMTMAVMKAAPIRSILPDREDICRDWFRCISSDAEIYGGSFLSIDASGIWSIPDFTEVADGTESDQIYQEILPGHGICIFYGDLKCDDPVVDRDAGQKDGSVKADLFLYNSAWCYDQYGWNCDHAGRSGCICITGIRDSSDIDRLSDRHRNGNDRFDRNRGRAECRSDHIVYGIYFGGTSGGGNRA